MDFGVFHCVPCDPLMTHSISQISLCVSSSSVPKYYRRKEKKSNYSHDGLCRGHST